MLLWKLGPRSAVAFNLAAPIRPGIVAAEPLALE